MTDLVKYRETTLAADVPAVCEIVLLSAPADELQYELRLPPMSDSAVDALMYELQMRDWAGEGSELSHTSFFPEYGWFPPADAYDALVIANYVPAEEPSVPNPGAAAGVAAVVFMVWTWFATILTFYPPLVMVAYVFASVIGLITYFLFIHNSGVVPRLRRGLKRQAATARLDLERTADAVVLHLDIAGRRRDPQTEALLVRELDRFVADFGSS